eukprot:CAMPEP_0116872124 /NCGR_PEP_ID=MMETSP0463-20121206/2786_1 /TAXON_ID=181622 /ORGANISM="Strombidinopsis sp, Strain SopsisLIS2011" /LENGTH=46 /DNA_ID= /DNA_START= /DNA_END= /DNA_ORIENTATION=
MKPDKSSLCKLKHTASVSITIASTNPRANDEIMISIICLKKLEKTE